MRLGGTDILSQSSIHAIRALMALSDLEEGRCEGSAAVAERVGAPPNYLGKLLQTLAHDGIVVSRRGKRGGWALARPAKDISLLNIVESLEDLDRWRGCFLTRADCSDESPCHVHDRWAAVRDAYLGFLKNTTLGQLSEDGGMPRLQLILAGG